MSAGRIIVTDSFRGPLRPLCDETGMT